jgi:hypothetical protein
MATYTTSGVTSFVLGKEADGNREMRTFKSGQEYDLDPATITAYTAANSRFPYVAS